MPFNPNLNNVKRYSRTFLIENPNHFVSPFYFMVAATTGVAGHVVKYTAGKEDTVSLATSGTLAYQVAGFLMQDVKDLDAGAIKGYRQFNNTVENLGGNVGVLQGPGNVCLTRQYNGSPAYLDRLAVAKDNSGNLETYASTQTGDPIAIVESVASAAQPTIEPTQFATGGNGNAYLRIRTYGL